MLPNFNDEDLTFCIEETRLLLRLDLLDEFRHVTRHGVTVTWRAVCNILCTVIDRGVVVLPDCLHDGKCVIS